MPLDISKRIRSSDLIAARSAARDQDVCGQVVERKSNGWLSLCCKPNHFGSRCVGHSIASEAIDVCEGLGLFFGLGKT